MQTALWWIRRDLRLSDNPALAEALSAASQVLPVFIIDPALASGPQTSAKRLAFLWASLRQLDADLRARGSALLLRLGPPLETLAGLLQESRTAAIYAAADFSPYARRRDAGVAATLPLCLVGSASLRHPAEVLKADGAPYTVYTPYSKTWKSLPLPTPASLLPAPAHISTPAGLQGLPIPAEPSLPASVPFLPGEAEAQRCLRAFTEGEAAPIYSYGDGRNRMDLEGSSQLSPYLRFGMLSARQADVAALEAQARARGAEALRGAEIWLNELIWREFYIAILYHFPDVLQHSFKPELRRIQWRNDPQDFAAWQAGRTGYPVVDAAMRQLLESGWMHNRARMIAASFLVKDLLVDWRWGERWFMQHLLDGDPAANNGGWQWTAGTGTDAAPYFRIFNPLLQSLKFDPHGVYIRRWLPELRQVPDEFIHQPWRMPADVQGQSACHIGLDYPAPLVDHAEARIWTLAAYGGGFRKRR